jgi:hypothetical protein
MPDRNNSAVRRSVTQCENSFCGVGTAGNCSACGHQLSPAAAWCRLHLNTYPSLWTAQQAADDRGCNVLAMGHEMAKHFTYRYIGDIKRKLYCVAPDAKFRDKGPLMSLGNKTLIALWHKHSDQRATNQALAEAFAHVERIAASQR